MRSFSLTPLIEQAVADGLVWLDFGKDDQPYAARLWPSGGDRELADICKIPSLTKLRCGGTLISSRGFRKVGKLRNLVYLAAENTAISGNDLRILTELPNLRELFCNPMAGTSKAAEHIGKHCKIRVLSLTNSSIDNRDLCTVMQSSAIEVLYISNCQMLTEDGFLVSPVFRKVRSLTCGDNPWVNDTVCRSLSNLEDIEELNVSGTMVSDSGVASLASLSNLTVLSIRGTKVTKGVFNVLKRFKKLSDLSLDFPMDDRDIFQISEAPNMTRLTINCLHASRKAVRWLMKNRKWDQLNIFPLPSKGK